MNFDTAFDVAFKFGVIGIEGGLVFQARIGLVWNSFSGAFQEEIVVCH